jgi:hypothetical protein
MSYCRWSSDDYRCDLYCYEDVHGGYTTHVASSRYDWEPPTPSPYSAEGMKALMKKPGGSDWAEASKAYHDKLQAAPLTPINLPFDGQSFNDPDLISFRQRLTDLRSAGYRFPQDVLDTVDEEIREEGGVPPVGRQLDFGGV